VIYSGLVNTNNGEILAIGNWPTYNNNYYQNYSQEIYNRLLPIYSSFEPGSTFKSFSFAAAINENLIDIDKDYYYDKGYEIVSNRTIKSWKKGGHGLQTYLEVLQNSLISLFL
jgi:stage V sporulation protein D (sporulation-specific penicillin-binding protein)